jgi:putative addiction module killer protein
MEVQQREIRRYIISDGRVPFAEWIDSLRDRNTRAKINNRLKRVSLGNLGDYCSVGGGVFELRIDLGPGYRVYFGQIGVTIVLLLCGGDKSTQDRDILKAKEYWAEYEERESANQ